MFSSPTCTLPSARAPGMVSCSLFRQRTKVDLPQPDGPMMAVARPGATSMEMPCSAWFLPNQAFRSCTLIPTATLVSTFQDATTGDDAHRTHRHHDQYDEHQRARPSLAVPLVIGRDGVCKDLQRQSGCRLIRVQVPE